MRPLLLCRLGEDEGLARLVGEEPLLIGRARDCAVALTDPQASRRHARISLQGSELRVEDLDSVRGTLVNGTRVGSGQALVLSHGDVVTLADTEIEIVDLDRVPAGRLVAGCIIGPGDYRVPLRRGSNVIGSAPECDLVVEDAEVASRHADLVLLEDACRLVREASAPPLFVNGEPVVEASLLASGDVFQLSPRAWFGVEVHLGTSTEEATEEEPPTAPPHPAFGAPQKAEEEHDRTHASPAGTGRQDTTSTLQLEEIRAALDRARRRHATEIPRPDDSGGARTPLPTPPAAPARPPQPPPDFRAARREAAVRIHVVVPGGEPVIVLLREGAHFLGRSERCRVRLTHASVMDEHAELWVGPQGVRVRALSPDGLVMRGGRRLAEGTVSPGERVTFGEMEAWFEEL